MAIRAVHLKVTSSFLNALHRFAARRGLPTKIYSDNGSNFQKVEFILKIDWQFGPPYGFHHQDLVEAAVEPAKQALYRTLTFEELNIMLFAQTKAALYSKAFCRSGDGSWTHGHFLAGRHLLIPDEFEAKNVCLEERKHLTDNCFVTFGSLGTSTIFDN